MKKILVAALAVVIGCAFAFAGCAKKENVKIVTVKSNPNEAIKLTDEAYAYGVDKNQPELKGKIDVILNRIKGDGTLDGIINKYFDDSKESERVTVEAGSENSSKADEQLTVATSPDFPPFEYKAGNKYTGIDIEIAKLIADELNMELVIKEMDFDSVVLNVQNHLSDVAMAGLTVTEDRAKVIDFTTSYYSSSQVLIVRESETAFDDCETAEDVENVLKTLKKKKASFQNGTTGQFYVEGDEGFGYEGFSNITAQGSKSGALAVQSLYNGSIDLVVIDEMPARSIVKSVNKK